MRERDDDRRAENGLRHDHGRGREQEAERSERPRPRQEQIDREPDHDRRQAEQRIGGNDQTALAAKPINGKRRAERRTDRKGAGTRRQADTERQDDDGA